MTTQPTNLPISQSTNPYVGPRTFSVEQRRLFFGREREARDLLARVLSERLLLFYAQSGAGKSSLLNARLIPQLQEERGFVVLPAARVSGELPTGVAQVDNIFIFNLLLSIDAGGDPARLAHVTLSDFLARLARRPVMDGQGQERRGWVYDAGLTPAPAPAGGQRYALIVDQFEEIITGHPAQWRQREEFFRQLDAALQADPNLWIILTLREDYVAALDPYAPLVFNRLRARFYMERMGVTAARDAVRRPAELGDRPFAPGVAEKLVEDLRQVRVPGQEAPVPGQYVEPVQLQVVCYQLWEGLARGDDGRMTTDDRRTTTDDGRIITAEDLARAGDVDRALTYFYEETLAAALADPAAAGVSERQVRAWFDGELITEAATRGLVHQGEAETAGLPNAVVRALQRRFLVRGEARGGDTWIELVHDRFVEPIRASNAAWFPQHLSALQRQAALWVEQGRSSGLLLRDASLTEAEVWAAAHPAEVGEAERQFLESCRHAQQSLERERRQNRRIRVLAAVALLLMTFAIAIAVYARDQQHRASRQARIARAEQLASSALAVLESESNQDPSLALMLARDAIAISREAGELPTVNAQNALQQVIDHVSPWIATLPRDRHEGAIFGVDFHPNGRTIATAGADETIRLWDVATGEQVQLLQGHEYGVWAVRFSQDGRYLVSSSLDGTARVWDVQTGQMRVRLPHGDIVWWASFNPDGRTIVTAGDDGWVRIWNPTSGKLLREWHGHQARVMTANFSPDGEQIVTASSDGSAKLWRVKDGALLRTLTYDLKAEVLSAEFDHTGKRVITAGSDGTARIWDSTTGEEILPRFESDYGGIKYAAFNPTDDIIVTAGLEGELIMWDVKSGERLHDLNGHSDLVNAVVFDPTGKYITSVSDDQSLRLWNNDTGEPTYFRAGHSGGVLEVEFHPDGSTIASGGADGSIILWDAAGGKMLRRLSGHTGQITALSFSPDGGTILSSSRDGTARLWSTATGEIWHVLEDHRSALRSARFSQDGRYVVTASADQTVRIWDPVTGERLAELPGHDDLILNAEADFDPAGKLVVTMGLDNTAQLWDWQADRIVHTLSGGHNDAISKAVFSPDGKMVATAGEDKRYCLWLLSDSDPPICQDGHQGPLIDIAFSPDGHLIATASADSTARVWNIEGKPIAQYIFEHGSNVTRVSFLDDKTLMTASEDKTIRFFDLNTGRQTLALRGHEDTVVDVSYSPQTAMVASASTDGTVRLWRTRSWGQARELQGHTGPILAVAYQPAGTLAASGGSDATVRLWDTANGSVLRVFDRHLAPVRAVAFSPMDPLVFSADEAGAAFLWRSDHGEIVHKLEGAEGAIYSSAFSPNGEMLVTTGDNGAVTLWNPATGQEITRSSGHAGKVLAAAFSPDGQTLATAGDDRVVQLWNIAARTSRRPLPEFAGPVNSIAFSPNGRLLATASYDEYLACPEPGISEAKPDLPAGRLVKLWDVETGKELSLAAGHTKQVTDLAFTSDGSRLISAGCDGAILTRRVDDGTLESSIRHIELEPIRAIAINSREESILTGGDDAVLRTWQSLDDLLEQADSLNQRQPKAYRAEERRRYFSTIEP